MTTETSTSTSSFHWLNYVLFGAVLLFLSWLWHDTQAHDTALLQALAAAKSNQSQVDTKAATDDTVALKTLQQQNTDLQNQLTASKTTAQQLAIVNKQLGTQIQQTPTQAINPSQSALPDAPKPAATLSAQDVTKLAQEATDCGEAKNQVAADQVIVASKDQQIAARDSTIKADAAEITAAKGGGRIKRFLKGAEYVGIGVAVGIIADKAASK